MKFIIAIIIASIAWYLIAWTIWEVTRERELILVIPSIISIAIFFISLKKLGRYASVAHMISSAIAALKDIKDRIEFNVEQKNVHLFAQAEEEFSKGEIDKGLWSQALIKAKGDESLRKVEYLKLRVKQLKKNA